MDFFAGAAFFCFGGTDLADAGDFLAAGPFCENWPDALAALFLIATTAAAEDFFAAGRVEDVCFEEAACGGVAAFVAGAVLVGAF